jgi:hypothetical protein
MTAQPRSSMGSHPQIASLSDNSLLIVWEEAFIEESNVYKRIGIQKRNSNGENLSKQFLTAEGSNASYPVLTAINDGSAMVAYTVKNGEYNFINYNKCIQKSQSR